WVRYRTHFLLSRDHRAWEAHRRRTRTFSSAEAEVTAHTPISSRALGAPALTAILARHSGTVKQQQRGDRRGGSAGGGVSRAGRDRRSLGPDGWRWALAPGRGCGDSGTSPARRR